MAREPEGRRSERDDAQFPAPPEDLEDIAHYLFGRVPEDLARRINRPDARAGRRGERQEDF
jgi:hypothetical protein